MTPEDVAAIEKSVVELQVELWSPLTSEERDLLRRALVMPNIERRTEAKDSPARRDTNGWSMS